MSLSPVARRRARYLVPVGAAALTAAIVFVPQAASGAQHPNLPPRTAAQLLASLERAKVPQFSGTVVESARLGLPNISDSSLAGSVAPSGQSGLMQVVTLLTGSHTAQIAYGGPDRQRVAIFLSDLSETDIVHNGTNIWSYSSDSNTVTHNTLDSATAPTTAPDVTTPVNPTKAAEQALSKIDPSTAVTVDRTAKVAGRAAYQIDLSPRDARTLVSSVRIALDSKTSLPLRVEIWSRKNTASPAFSVGFTSISMSPPSASTFDFTKPPSATTVPQPFSHVLPTRPAHPGGQAATAGPAARMTVLGKDWTSVWVDKLSNEPVPLGAAGVKASSHSGPLVGSSVQAAPGSSANPPRGPTLAEELGQLGTRVAAGHLVTTNLVTILITNDNRILIGAVTPAYIEQLSAEKAAQ